MKFIVNNPVELVTVLNDLTTKNEWPLTLSVKADGKRSLPANAVVYCFYKEISNYTGEDVKTVTHRMKRDIGFPILMASDYGKKVSWMLNKFGFHGMTEQQQLNMMELIPVTSLFSSKEHSLYRDNMRSFWREQGLNLEYK